MDQTHELVDFDEIQAVIKSNDWPISAAELHGYQCGLISLGLNMKDSTEEVNWFRLFSIDYPHSNEKNISSEDQQLLIMLWNWTLHGLSSDNFQFYLLLPDDDASLILRVNTLAEWCAGYLSGIQTALTLIDQTVRDRMKASEQIQELLIDLSAIRQVENLELNDVEDLLETERNYAEICEFVRVATLNIYMEVVLGILNDVKTSIRK